MCHENQANLIRSRDYYQGPVGFLSQRHTSPLITICWRRDRAELRSPRRFGIVNTVIPMTLAEQLQGYQNEWVLIEYTELDEHLNAIHGRVIAHSPNKDEIYRILSQTHGKNVIVEYVGELPKDLAVMLSAP